MGLRRKSRELALQFFYGHDLQKRPGTEDTLQAELQEFFVCFKNEQKALPYAEQLIVGICARQQDIDSALSRCSHHWRMERMALVDRNILRIAAYEMQYVEDVPATVVINEALEIAKRYAEPDAVAFINGILDGL
ncbi:MAG: transcription antitermination factor NusB, partial [Candidatus Electrothrix sp. AR4]|nr:transcription antitermination factor NusB [Candidatus Electrothrix sp. AR4]